MKKLLLFISLILIQPIQPADLFDVNTRKEFLKKEGLSWYLKYGSPKVLGLIENKKLEVCLKEKKVTYLTQLKDKKKFTEKEIKTSVKKQKDKENKICLTLSNKAKSAINEGEKLIKSNFPYENFVKSVKNRKFNIEPVLLPVLYNQLLYSFLDKIMVTYKPKDVRFRTKKVATKKTPTKQVVKKSQKENKKTATANK